MATKTKRTNGRATVTLKQTWVVGVAAHRQRQSPRRARELLVLEHRKIRRHLGGGGGVGGGCRIGSGSRRTRWWCGGPRPIRVAAMRRPRRCSRCRSKACRGREQRRLDCAQPGAALVRRAELQPEIHRVDPESGSSISKALIRSFSHTAGSTCEFWVSPVNFTSAAAAARLAPRLQHPTAVRLLQALRAAHGFPHALLCLGSGHPRGRADAWHGAPTRPG